MAEVTGNIGRDGPEGERELVARGRFLDTEPDDPEAAALHWANIAWQVGDRCRIVDAAGLTLCLGTVSIAERDGQGRFTIQARPDEPERLYHLAQAYGGALPPLKIEPAE